MQSKEETRNETVRKRNCGNKQAEHDETLSTVWDESIKAGRQITEEYREGREKVMEYKDFVEQVKEQIQDFLPDKFADATVSVHQVVKNNDCVLDGAMSIPWTQEVELFSQHNICRENYFLC